MDAFRPYFYHANVAGVADGFQVRAHDSSTQGIASSKQFTGTAGGFAGSLVNGSAKRLRCDRPHERVRRELYGWLRGASGQGRNGRWDNAQVNHLLGATAGVLDVWGSHVDRSTVAGIADGYTVTSSHQGADYGLGTNTAKGREVAGGFVGYADLARVNDCDAGNLKLVSSGEIAGGFAGEAQRAHLVETEVNSWLLDLVLFVVNALLKVLYVPGLENLDVISLGKWFGIGKIFDLKVLADGDAVYVNLFRSENRRRRFRKSALKTSGNRRGHHHDRRLRHQAPVHRGRHHRYRKRQIQPDGRTHQGQPRSRRGLLGHGCCQRLRRLRRRRIAKCGWRG
ncbi:MAG: hypothetical protein ACLTSX_03730 [Collinsella sp.]